MPLATAFFLRFLAALAFFSAVSGGERTCMAARMASATDTSAREVGPELLSFPFCLSCIPETYRYDSSVTFSPGVVVMHQREYDRLKKRIEAEYREKLGALDLVWKMAGNSGSTKVRATPLESSLVDSVRRALDQITGSFTIKTVSEGCAAILPDGKWFAGTSVSVILKRMADDGQLTIIERGRGRKATIYEKTKENPAGPGSGPGIRRVNESVPAASDPGDR